MRTPPNPLPAANSRRPLVIPFFLAVTHGGFRLARNVKWQGFGNPIGLVVLVATFCLVAYPAMAQFTYTINNGITITGYSGPGGSVIIPAIINGLPVTAIGDNAFYGDANVIGVTIPG